VVRVKEEARERGSVCIKVNDDDDDDDQSERARKVGKKALNLLHKNLARPLLPLGQQKKEKRLVFGQIRAGPTISFPVSLFLSLSDRPVVE